MESVDQFLNLDTFVDTGMSLTTVLNSKMSANEDKI